MAPWRALEDSFHNALLAVASAMSASAVDPDVWRNFEPDDAPKDVEPAVREAAIEQFRTALGGQEQVAKIDDAVKRALQPFVERGRLDKVPTEELFRFDQISVDDLPEKLRTHRSDRLVVSAEDASELVTLEELERRYIHRVLKMLGGNKSRAAQVLGLDRRTLYRKLDRYDDKASAAAGSPPLSEARSQR